ncbi:MAG: hypothetical protein ACLUOF_06485 [Ruminococcus sp.]
MRAYPAVPGYAWPAGYESYRVIRLQDSLNAVLLRIETRGKADYPVVNRIQDSITIRLLYPELGAPGAAGTGNFSGGLYRNRFAQGIFHVVCGTFGGESHSERGICADFRTVRL